MHKMHIVVFRVSKDKNDSLRDKTLKQPYLCKNDKGEEDTCKNGEEEIPACKKEFLRSSFAMWKVAASDFMSKVQSHIFQKQIFYNKTENLFFTKKVNLANIKIKKPDNSHWSNIQGLTSPILHKTFFYEVDYSEFKNTIVQFTPYYMRFCEAKGLSLKSKSKTTLNDFFEDMLKSAFFILYNFSADFLWENSDIANSLYRELNAKCTDLNSNVRIGSIKVLTCECCGRIFSAEENSDSIFCPNCLKSL